MELDSEETFWRDLQPWLFSRGYQLRARYQPDWIPSWVTNPPAERYEVRQREDNVRRGQIPVMDAVRARDDKPVMLKKVRKAGNEYDWELAISQYVSSPELMKDSDNHCVPVYEVLDIPNDPEHSIIVMPLLYPFHITRFDTIGECLDFFYQIFKGIQFLHRHHIAHRDCTANNVMMDPSEIYPEGFHPVKYRMNRDYTGPASPKCTRTQCPPKYYWIDYGLSVHFEESYKFPRAVTLRGGDKSAPEFQDIKHLHTARDPFPTDIYYLGNLIRIYFTEGHPDNIDGYIYGLGFMKPLVDAMVQEDPSKRPTIDQCVIHLEEIICSRNPSTLRSQTRAIRASTGNFELQKDTLLLLSLTLQPPERMVEDALQKDMAADSVNRIWGRMSMMSDLRRLDVFLQDNALNAAEIFE
uniref:Protein kinase domain-containing protein n=1 Tax=Psilocybe cubensis TaxID=181762 RepID=A0A8H7XMQ5_PSICU